MNKKNLLSRLNAKFALAVMALTSAFFIGCSDENLDITGAGETTTLPDAVCVINVSVLDLTHGNTISDATLTATSGTVVGNTVTLTGSSISATTITITASATGYVSGSTTVSIPALSEGQSLSLSAIILLSQESGDDDYYLVSLVETQHTSTSTTSEITDEKWVNSTDEAIVTDLVVQGKEGYEMQSKPADLTTIAEGIYDSMKKNEVEEYDITYSNVTIPANSHATVTIVEKVAEVEYTVTETNGTDVVTSSFKANKYTTSAYYTISGDTSTTSFTITLSVVDEEGNALPDLVSDLVVEPSTYVIEDGAITITGTDKIEAASLTITYPGNDDYASSSVHVEVPELQKGSVGTEIVTITVYKKNNYGFAISLSIDVGELEGDWTLIYEEENAGNYCMVVKGVTYTADKVSTVDENFNGIEGTYNTVDDIKALVDMIAETVVVTQENVTTYVEFEEDEQFHVLPGYIYRVYKNTYVGTVTVNVTIAGVENGDLSASKEFYTPTATPELEDTGHGHSHGHSHGDFGNSGGGIVIPIN